MNNVGMESRNNAYNNKSIIKSGLEYGALGAACNLGTGLAFLSKTNKALNIVKNSTLPVDELVKKVSSDEVKNIDTYLVNNVRKLRITLPKGTEITSDLLKNTLTESKQLLKKKIPQNMLKIGIISAAIGMAYTGICSIIDKRNQNSELK